MLRCESCVLFWMVAASEISVNGAAALRHEPDAMKTQPSNQPDNQKNREPAMMMVATAARSIMSFSADHHIADLQRRRRDRSEKSHVVADHFDVF